MLPELGKIKSIWVKSIKKVENNLLYDFQFNFFASEHQLNLKNDKPLQSPPLPYSILHFNYPERNRTYI